MGGVSKLHRNSNMSYARYAKSYWWESGLDAIIIFGKPVFSGKEFLVGKSARIEYIYLFLSVRRMQRDVSSR